MSGLLLRKYRVIVKRWGFLGIVTYNKFQTTTSFLIPELQGRDERLVAGSGYLL